MRTFTPRQEQEIKPNLNAFIFHFGPVRIERQDPRCPGFYVYYPADSSSYIQYCHSFDYLDGWLYGAVQSVTNGLKSRLGGEKKE